MKEKQLIRITITGMQGCGKTTFIGFLEHILEAYSRVVQVRFRITERTTKQ